MTYSCTVEGCTSKHYGKGYCQKHYNRVRRTGSPETVRAGHRYETQNVARRLSERTTRDGDCLIYASQQKTRSGHVVIGRDGQYVGVHRAAWELANGSVPHGMFVLHRCDRPRCVNVAHLFLGTIADNNADRDRKGRHVALCGEANGSAKLDAASVAEIKRRLLAGGTTRQLASEYGVHQSAVWSISAGRTWKHVEPTPALDGVAWPTTTVAVAR